MQPHDEPIDVACPNTNNDNNNNDSSFKSVKDDDDDGERNVNVQVQELAVVTDKPNHDQAQQLNDFDSAKAVNRYILQTNSNTNNNNSSNTNTHSNNIINENNDATATSAINENSLQSDSCPNSTNTTADTIELVDASAQVDKHNTAINNSYHNNAAGATTENVEYATVAATDLGTTLAVQGVEHEQSENFVVTSGYIQECKYHSL